MIQNSVGDKHMQHPAVFAKPSASHRGLDGLVQQRGHVLLLVSVGGAEHHHPVLRDKEKTEGKRSKLSAHKNQPFLSTRALPFPVVISMPFATCQGPFVPFFAYYIYICISLHISVKTWDNTQYVPFIEEGRGNGISLAYLN